jgi:hypothetical protein
VSLGDGVCRACADCGDCLIEDLNVNKKVYKRSMGSRWVNTHRVKAWY